MSSHNGLVIFLVGMNREKWTFVSYVGMGEIDKGEAVKLLCKFYMNYSQYISDIS